MKRLTPILLMANNTLVEAGRQKFFTFLLLLSGALLLSSNFFRQFDFGHSELSFIFDFGSGSVFLFGTLVAVVSTASLFFSEIENRTALTLLAKPLHRAELMLGKFLGLGLLSLIFTMLLIGILALVLYLRETELMPRNPQAFENGRLIDYGGLFLFGLVQWLRLLILVSLTLFIASFATSQLFTIAVSFFIMMIAQLQYIAQESWSDLESPIWRNIVWLFSKIFPNFQIFNIGKPMVLEAQYAITTMDLVQLLGYALVYAFGYILMAAISFQKREI